MKEGIIPGNREKVRDIILAKFLSHMETFLSDGCFTDGFRSKKLKDSVYELRIALPSDFLLRVIFAMEKGRIILTTGYLIKEGWEDYDKRTKAKVEKLYELRILEAEAVFRDFQGKQENNYIQISHIF